MLRHQSKLLTLVYNRLC